MRRQRCCRDARAPHTERGYQHDILMTGECKENEITPSAFRYTSPYKFRKQERLQSLLFFERRLFCLLLSFRFAASALATEFLSMPEEYLISGTVAREIKAPTGNVTVYDQLIERRAKLFFNLGRLKVWTQIQNLT